MAVIVVPCLVAIAAVFVALRANAEARQARAHHQRLRKLTAYCRELTVALVDREHRITVIEGPVIGASIASAGQLLSDVVSAEKAERLLPLIDAALAGRTSRVEFDGTRVDTVFRIDVAPYGEDDEITHAAVTVRDIGAGVAMQRALAEQRTFLAAVLAQLGDRVSVADGGGRLLSFDGSMPAEDLHPLEWAEHFGLQHADGTPYGPHETPLLRALRGEDVRDAEARVGERVLLQSGGPVHDEEGRRLGAVVVTADLTDFRDAEGRLRASEERHRQLVESVSDCVFETDARGVWTHLSEAWTSATGFAVEDCLGRPCWDFVHPDDRAEHARAFAPLMGGERAGLRHSHRFLTASGAERWGEVQVRAISGWDGLPKAFVGVMRDVTAERRAQQHVAAEQAVMRHLTMSDGIDDAGAGLIEVLGRELGWDAAELWRMGADESLRRFGHWSAPGVELEQFLRAGDRLTYEVGDGLPGQAWMSRVPLWKSDIEGETMLVRLQEGLADGVRSTVALPLRADGAPVGVVVLVSRSPREPEPGLVRLLESIGGQLTQFLQRREAEGRAAAQAADLRQLSVIAHELAGQTDFFAARHTLVRAVRDVTRSDSVALLEPSGETLLVSAAIGAAINGMRVDLDARSLTAEAFMTRDPRFVADVDADARAARCQTVAGAASAAWVPVVRDGDCVAVLAVGWATLRPQLPQRDQELLRLLAAEAAITIHRTDLLARLQSTARTDPLTGLPNRRVWDEDLARELARAQRHGGSLCLAILDLDRFKAYNDTYGHQAGDELLALAATAWRPELRTTDTIARYGGEEFAVLLPHSDEAGALAVVERLLAVVPHDQTASAGVAVWDGSESSETLMARADAALYEAKGAGRARALVAA